MSNGSKWHDFPLTQGPEYIGVTGFIGGEHTYGYYIADVNKASAIAQIVVCPSAVPPDAPPDENKAPEFHYNTQPDFTQPQATFGTDGICTSEGWTPAGAAGGYYKVGDTTEHPTGTPVATLGAKSSLEAAALAFARAQGLK